MSTITFDFENFNTGALNGQQGWVSDSYFTVQTSVKYAGTKAVSAGAAANVWRSAQFDFTQSVSGKLTLYSRYSTTNYWSSLFALYNQANVEICDVRKQYDNTWQFNSAVYSLIKNGAINTWFKIEIEWNASGQVRAAVDGTWTPWRSPLVAFATVGRLVCSPQAECFFDNLTLELPDIVSDNPALLLSMV